MSTLEKVTGSFPKAVEEASRLLGVKGKVIPVTLDDTRLAASLENGLVIRGEGNIDIPKHDGRLHIKKVSLHPRAKANPAALQAIKQADTIVMGPGDLYTSIVPNCLVQGVKEAIKKSKAKKIYVCNIMTKYGETNEFSAEQFLDVLETYLGKGVIDYFIVNVSKPQLKYLSGYKKEKAEVVKYNRKLLKNRKKLKVIFARLLRKGSLLRHDPKKLARVIYRLTD